MDSAFDEIIMARPLKIAQSRDVLEQRGVSMPEPYLWLCHILSGGLPRDMIRVVVSLAAAKGRSSSDQLNELACELIRENASMVLTGQIRHAYTVSEQEMSIVSDWLARALSALPKADELEDLCLAVPEVAAGSTSAKTTMECQSFLYFIATMIRIFVDGSAPIVEWLRHASSLDPIDHIAMARSELAADPGAAWRRIDSFRSEHPRLSPLFTRFIWGSDSGRRPKDRADLGGRDTQARCRKPL